MKEYIERASVHSIIEQTSTFTFAWGGMHEQIDSLPAANVAEVVRCRECAHYKICDEWENGKRMLCEIHHHSYLDHDGDNHFCSWGQRKIETVLPKSDAKNESLEAAHEI